MALGQLYVLNIMATLNSEDCLPNMEVRYRKSWAGDCKKEG